MNFHFKKIYHIVLIFCLFSNRNILIAQENATANDSKIIRKVADRILKHTTFDFATRSNKQIIGKLDNSNNAIVADSLIIRSPYNTWSY